MDKNISSSNASLEIKKYLGKLTSQSTAMLLVN